MSKERTSDSKAIPVSKAHFPSPSPSRSHAHPLYNPQPRPPPTLTHLPLQISHNATDQSLYIAGHPHTTSSNRILAFVRHNSTRAKSTYDTLASHLDSAWRDAIYGEVITEGKDKGKRPKEVDEIERDMLARKLLAVAFVPIVAVRELGTAMPEAGAEAAWFAENLEFFRKQSEEKGDEIVTAMLEEVSTREDLKAYREGEGVSGLLNKLKLTASGQGEKK